VLMERGMLNDIFKPYEAKKHDSGFEMVLGNTVQMDTLETGQAGTKAKYQELISVGAMRAGFLEIEDSRFDWEIQDEEISYVIEGSVSIIVEGMTFKANPGDVLHFPLGTKVVWDVAGNTKLFYVTSASTSK